MVAVVAVLMSLLLPAVQQAREAARSTACKNKLKQLTLAAHHYESTYRTLPSGGNGGGSAAASGAAFSVDARLLPYLDQSPLQDLIDFREPVPGGRPLGFHNPAAYVSVPTYLCPSDPAPDGAEVKFGRFSFGTDLKGTNYPVNSGSGAYEEGVKAYYDPAFPTDGPFYFDSSTPFAGLRDGVTNTLLASECVRGLGVDLTDTPRESLSRPYAVAASLSAGRGRVGEAPGGVDPMFTGAEARAAADWRGDRGDRGYPWIWGRVSATLFNAALGPDSDTPDAFAHSRGWFAARRYHPGGVDAALADGSVAFASDSIDADTWRAFSTRAGGEVTEGL